MAAKSYFVAKDSAHYYAVREFADCGGRQLCRFQTRDEAAAVCRSLNTLIYMIWPYGTFHA